MSKLRSNCGFTDVFLLCADLSAAFEPHAALGSLPLETSAESAQVLPPARGKSTVHTPCVHKQAVHVTRPSPTLVLQATNTGVRRPGNEATNM